MKHTQQVSGTSHLDGAQTSASDDKRGIIKMLLLIIVGVVIISVLGFDIRAAVEHPQTQENFSYLGGFVVDVWDAYLEPVWEVIWNIIGPVVDAIWEFAQNFSWNDYDNQMSDFMDSSPQTPTVN